MSGLLPIGAALGVDPPDVPLAFGVAGLEGIWSSTPCDGVPDVRRVRPGGVDEGGVFLPASASPGECFFPLLLVPPLVAAECGMAAAAAEEEEGLEAVGEVMSCLLRFLRMLSSPSSASASSMSTSESSSPCLRFCPAPAPVPPTPPPPMICASRASSLMVSVPADLDFSGPLPLAALAVLAGGLACW